jgi:hypothetical protein
MLRRPSLVTAFWRQADLFPLEQKLFPTGRDCVKSLSPHPWIGVKKSSLQYFTAIVLLLATPSSNLPIARSTDKLPITIPVVVADDLVYMQGRINDSQQLSVVLDTGSSLSIVSPAVAQQIGLHPSGSAEAAGIGHGGNETVQVVEDAACNWAVKVQLCGSRVSELRFCQSATSPSRSAARLIRFSAAMCSTLLE